MQAMCLQGDQARNLAQQAPPAHDGLHENSLAANHDEDAAEDVDAPGALHRDEDGQLAARVMQHARHEVFQLKRESTSELE